MIQLGDKVKDTVSGFEGIATGKIIWMNGCVRFAVQGKAKKGEKPDDVVWIDEPQLIVIKPISVLKKISTGGPTPIPPSREPR